MFKKIKEHLFEKCETSRVWIYLDWVFTILVIAYAACHIMVAPNV
jgi:hypothetical protein